jgi:AbrB family looped-hinge helix DNA binding protein
VIKYVIFNYLAFNMSRMTTIGKAGRLVIPAQYRQALGLTEGEGVMISLKNGHIEITPIEESIKKAQQTVKQYLSSEDDLVTLLFDDRKEDERHE